MAIPTKQIIGDIFSAKGQDTFQAINPATQEVLPGTFYEATAGEIRQAFEKAEEAFEGLREVTRTRRAEFLEQIANEILSLDAELVQRAIAETALPEARIIGERGRTVNQLRSFAEVVRQGDYLEVSIDTAQPDRTPLPRPDIRMVNIPIGTVAVFGASNFPLAFSVAGGDTASALAAGCPVVVKAHPAHPGTSALVGQAIKSAAEKTGMPEGVFSLIHGKGIASGQWMVTDPLAAAVAFTGSYHGGKALFDLCASRDNPIPCFAEMGSTNPVFLLPDKLEGQADSIAGQYVDSVHLGVGQFCTNPGLVFGLRGDAMDTFISKAAKKLSSLAGGTMLHDGIRNNYNQSTATTATQQDVTLVASGTGSEDASGIARLFQTSGKNFLQNPALQQEMFGPASIIITCTDEEELLLAARVLRGNLTATLQATAADLDRFRPLINTLERKVGRLLVNGFPTGVEVCHSMVHGGPYPATTDSRFTSVGTASIKRFLRPVCYQNFPEEALKEELRDGSGIRKKINGEYQ